MLIAPVWDTNCKIQNTKYRNKKTSNIKPTKCNLVYQAIPKKLVKVDKLQTTFKSAERTKIYSVRRKAIPDIYNSLSETKWTWSACFCWVWGQSERAQWQCWSHWRSSTHWSHRTWRSTEPGIRAWSAPAAEAAAPALPRRPSLWRPALTSLYRLMLRPNVTVGTDNLNERHSTKTHCLTYTSDTHNDNNHEIWMSDNIEFLFLNSKIQLYHHS